MSRHSRCVLRSHPQLGRRNSTTYLLTLIFWGIIIMTTFVDKGDGTVAEDTPNPIIIQGPTNLQENHETLGEVTHATMPAVDRRISIEGDSFILDGRPLQIISGSLHYFRLPAEYWRDRLRKLKAAGLNAVATYVEWSYHEPEERQYSFDGDRDVAQFVRLARNEGLLVLLRPGPYICAERDLEPDMVPHKPATGPKLTQAQERCAFNLRVITCSGLSDNGTGYSLQMNGGLPYWLLGKYPNIKLRSANKDFINETRMWMRKLFEQISPLLYGNGGPIILVQVENEYGSYGNSRAYKELVRDILLEHVGSNALLYTTDGTSKSMIEGGSVAGALPTIDFGVGNDINKVFEPLRQLMPRGPLMNSEFYPGWLTHWGEHLQQVATHDVILTFQDMLRKQINVNFYVFYGGTNFEFYAGANYFGSYQPDITSYDYDAPLNEAGDPTPKYYAIRDVLIKRNPAVIEIPPPQPAPKGNYGKISLTSEINLLSSEGRSQIGKLYKDTLGAVLPTFEELRQRSGLMLYETTLDEFEGQLVVTKPRDWIYVYVDSELRGILNRMFKKHTLYIKCKPGATLSLLVENQGRINYGDQIHDFKGIRSVVEFNKRILNGTWTVTGYPLETLNFKSSKDSQSLEHGPVLYQGHLILPNGKQPLDTFLDTSDWGRGYVWVNGHNLGRYWPARGPQVTLYVPGVWLHAAPHANLVRVLELEQAPRDPAMQFIDHPILNKTD